MYSSKLHLLTIMGNSCDNKKKIHNTIRTDLNVSPEHRYTQINEPHWWCNSCCAREGYIVGLSCDWVKPKTITLVFVVFQSALRRKSKDWLVQN